MPILLNPGYVLNGRKAFAQEQLTVTNASKALTEATYGDTAQTGGPVQTGNKRRRALHAVIQVVAQPVTFTLDGTTPTASVGILALAGDLIPLLNYSDLVNFRAIRTGGTDATLTVVYFR